MNGIVSGGDLLDGLLQLAFYPATSQGFSKAFVGLRYWSAVMIHIVGCNCQVVRFANAVELRVESISGRILVSGARPTGSASLRCQAPQAQSEQGDAGGLRGRDHSLNEVNFAVKRARSSGHCEISRCSSFFSFG
jgi:hypothetical protein